MMKRIIALISIVLSFCTLVSAIPITSFASESDDKYKEAVVEQYKDSFSDNDYYSRLVSEGYTYYYKIWANNIDNKGELTKGYLWCVNKIMGTELDTLAYVEYLTKLMEMFDSSYVDFIANQSQWTKKLTLEDYADETGKIAVKALVGAAGFDEIEKAFAFLGATKDLTDVADKLLEDEKEIAVLSVATTNYQKKRTVLQAIYDNAEDEHLKEAAQIKMYECDMKYIYVADECLTDITTAVAKLGDEVFELKVLEHIADSVADGFADWAKEYAGETIGGAMSIVVTFCAVNIGYIAIGAEIGVAISKMTMGNKYETFREAMAMDRISTALSKALKKLKSSADSTGEYETIRDYVYIGGALIYVHLRGEYCDADQRIGSQKTLAQKAYYVTESRLNECRITLTEILIYEDVDFMKIFELHDGFMVEVEQKTTVPEGYVGIYSFEDLLAAREDLDQNYILMADIWCGSYENEENHKLEFEGDFDGNGYTISNVHTPLFSVLDGYCTVKNLGICVDAIVTEENEHFGALAYLAYDTTFENCYVDGTVSIQTSTKERHDLYVGGFVAKNGHFTNCYSSVNYSGNGAGVYVGGLSGYHTQLDDCSHFVNCFNEGNISVSATEHIAAGGLMAKASYGYFYTTIEHCYNKGDINVSSVDASAGGIFGSLSGSGEKTTKLCYNLGNITAKGTDEVYAGGIAGYAYSMLGQCTNTGSIVSSSYAGGIVGYGEKLQYYDDIINTGTVSGDDYSGGIVGAIDPDSGTGTFSRCCSFGNSESGTENGIFVGHVEKTPSFYDSYYLAEGDGMLTSTLSEAESVTGLTKEELFDKNSYTNFDWEEIWYFDKKDEDCPVKLRY